jgi:hypothetical protein
MIFATQLRILQIHPLKQFWTKKYTHYNHLTIFFLSQVTQFFLIRWNLPPNSQRMGSHFPLTCCLVFLTTFNIYHNFQHLMPFSDKLSSPLQTFIITTTFYHFYSCVKEIHVDHHQHHLNAYVVCNLFSFFLCWEMMMFQASTKIYMQLTFYIIIYDWNLPILFQALDWKVGCVMDIRAPYNSCTIQGVCYWNTLSYNKSNTKPIPTQLE